MTRYSANLESLRPHELAQINPDDAGRLALSEGDTARVTSRRGSITTRVTVTDTVPPGVVFMTFHYKESPVNELTNSAFDPVTKTAEFKVCAVRIEKVAETELVGAAPAARSGAVVSAAPPVDAPSPRR
jgi:predicted molibdopterin-dependent oxidoreductase YjgC